MGLKEKWKSFTKDREECNVEELKKKQKHETFLYFFCWFVGLGVYILAFYIYLKTSIIGLSLFGAVYGIFLALLAMDCLNSKRQLSLFIYLKQREKDEY